jgi:hypothetical protein
VPASEVVEFDRSACSADSSALDEGIRHLSEIVEQQAVREPTRFERDHGSGRSDEERCDQRVIAVLRADVEAHHPGTQVVDHDVGDGRLDDSVHVDLRADKLWDHDTHALTGEHPARHLGRHEARARQPQAT